MMQFSIRQIINIKAQKSITKTEEKNIFWPPLSREVCVSYETIIAYSIEAGNFITWLDRLQFRSRVVICTQYTQFDNHLYKLNTNIVAECEYFDLNLEQFRRVSFIH